MGLGLNLEGADLSGFDPLPSGQYHAQVFEVEMRATKGGEDAKLPKDTPMINVQYKILGKVGEETGEDAPFFNRRVFGTYIIAPATVDGQPYNNKKTMDGILARFLTAIGYSEDEVTSGNFDPDLDDFVGRECTITVSQYEYDGETRNRVKGVKPPMVSEEPGGLL